MAVGRPCDGHFFTEGGPLAHFNHLAWRVRAVYQVLGVADRMVNLATDLVHFFFAVQVPSNSVIGLDELVELTLQVLVLL